MGVGRFDLPDCDNRRAGSTGRQRCLRFQQRYAGGGNGHAQSDAGFQQLLCTADGVPAIDVLLNVMKFSMTTGGSINLDYLKKLNVPVLAAYTTIAPFEEWKDSFEGMNAMEVSISVSLPEFDGIIHGVPIAHKKFWKTAMSAICLIWSV